MTAVGKSVLGLVLVVGVASAAVLATVVASDGLDDRATAVLDDPAAFTGERVTVRGELSSYYPEAFTLGGGWLNGDELLVLVDELKALPQPIRDRANGIEVRVTGVVGRKDDSVELVPGERFEPFEDGVPYIRADRVEILAG